MPLNIPLINNPTPKTFAKMLNLEASQLSLPDSPELMKIMIAAYVAFQMGAQYFNHSIYGSLIYGFGGAVLLYGATFYLLKYMKNDIG